MTGAFWERLNPELWDATHNAWAFLQSWKELRPIRRLFQHGVSECVDSPGGESDSLAEIAPQSACGAVLWGDQSWPQPAFSRPRRA